jgi:hypothetical protein
MCVRLKFTLIITRCTEINVMISYLLEDDVLNLFKLIVVVLLRRYMFLAWCDYSKCELSYGHHSASAGEKCV